MPATLYFYDRVVVTQWTIHRAVTDLNKLNVRLALVYNPIMPFGSNI